MIPRPLIVTIWWYHRKCIAEAAKFSIVATTKAWNVDLYTYYIQVQTKKNIAMNVSNTAFIKKFFMKTLMFS